MLQSYNIGLWARGALLRPPTGSFIFLQDNLPVGMLEAVIGAQRDGFWPLAEWRSQYSLRRVTGGSSHGWQSCAGSYRKLLSCLSLGILQS